MAKSKTPFFSMGAKGTVGGVLTAQKRGGDTVLRSTPVPTDPYSLAQAYQRWDYRDYAYLWTLLTDSQKQVYRTNASKYHITGFSLWMREHLKDLPDIDIRWRFDEKSGAVAYDSSKNNLNGTIIGATPASGVIDGQLYFDGLNDRVFVNRHAALDFTDEMTLECFYTIKGINRWNRISGFDTPGNPRYLLYQHSNNTFQAYVNDGVNSGGPISPLAYTGIGDVHHLALRIDADSVDLLVDGYQVATAVVSLNNFSPAGPFQVGCYNTPPGNFANGYVDNVIKYNRALDDTELLRHSKRRYPA